MEEKENVIVFYDENNEEIEFEILGQVEYEDENYILVVDANVEEDDEDEAFILKERSINDEEVMYDFIEDKEEYLKVLELFMESDEFDIEYLPEEED